MQTSYRLSVAELDERFLQSVKALFTRPDEEIEITINNTRDDTAYLLSSEPNRRHLEAALEDVKAGLNLTDIPLEKVQALQRGVSRFTSRRSRIFLPGAKRIEEFRRR